MTLPSRSVAALASGAIVLVAGTIGAWAWMHHAAGNSAPAIGGPFTLHDAKGTVTDRDFRGRWMLVYFGYTHCPDACPTTLNDMASTLDKMTKADRDRVVPIFITVDPDRDTPEVVDDYAKAFGPAFIGLSGSQAEISAVEREYRVYAQKHPLKGQDYAMDHSSIVYVMRPDGGFSSIFTGTETPAEMAQRLTLLGA
jgi:protein SCO1/2